MTDCTETDCRFRIDKDNFINFAELDTLKSFEFKLVWDDYASVKWIQGTGLRYTFLDLIFSKMVSSKFNTWLQDKNPNLITDIDAKAKNVHFSIPGGKIRGFQGLSRSTSKRTLFDGQKGPHWWYSIGYGYLFHQTGQPAFIASGSNINSHYVSKV